MDFFHRSSPRGGARAKKTGAWGEYAGVRGVIIIAIDKTSWTGTALISDSSQGCQPELDVVSETGLLI